MFSYYGSKSKIVHLYPAPKYGLVIEPFAGSARYALRHFEKDVILCDPDKYVIAIWKYLQQASVKDILALPSMLPGESTDSYEFECQEAKWLMGFIVQGGVNAPRKTVSPTGNFGGSIESEIRRISSQLFKIRHWQIIQGSYECLENREATWFIDPPYFQGGEHYRHGTNRIDFAEIADFAKTRKGQVIVCENSAATWMPFMKLKKMRGSLKTTTEVWWTSEPEPTQESLF